MTNRREFLAAVAAAGGAANGLALSVAAAETPTFSEFSGIRLAIATICCDGFGDEGFTPTFELLPRTGFRHVEFNCWYPSTLTPAGIAGISRRCREANVAPICVQGNAFRDGSAADVAHKLWCMQAARTLGCRRVKFTGSKRDTQGGLKAVVSSLRELAPAAEEMDVLICVENHANNNIENIADYDTIFSSIDSSHVGMCLDTGHFDGAGVEIPEVIRRFGKRVAHVDLKDCQSKGKYKTVRFGEGVTDNEGAIESLIAIGYDGYLVVEQAPPIDSQTLRDDLRAAYLRFAKYERS